MNKLLLAILLITTQAIGAISEPDKASLGTYKNYATNGGAENSKTGWSVSGTSSALTDLAVDTDAADRYSGNAGFTWTPANADNYLSNTAYTVVSNGQLSSRNCAVKVFTKTSSTTHALEAYDGSNVLSTVTITASTNFTLTTLNFQCPSSGTVQVRFNAGDTTAITFDDLSWGDAYGVNLQNISQAQIIGRLKYPKATNCNWVETTSAAWTSFSADSDCTTPTGSNLEGSATAPSTKIPGVTFASLPPGDYEISVHGHFVCVENAANNARCGVRLYDGTNGSFESVGGSIGAGGAITSINVTTGPLTAVFRYTTAQSNITFQLQGYFDNTTGTDSVQIQTDAGTSSSVDGLTFTVKKLPTSSEIALNPSQTPALWSGYHEDTCVFPFASTSLVDSSDDGTCTLVETKNVNFGTVVTYGAAKPGITFTPKITGDFEVCASFSADNSATGETKFELSDTVPTVINTVIKQADTNIQDYVVCGIYNVASIGSKTVRLRGATDSGTVSITSASYTSFNAKPVRWTIKQITPQVSNPQIVNTVTSASSGGVKLASAYITNSGTPTVSSQDGSFISSVTDGGVGLSTVNFTASTWSAAPRCFCQTTNAANAIQCNITSTPSTSSVSIETENSSTGADSDRDYVLFCIGAK